LKLLAAKEAEAQSLLVRNDQHFSNEIMKAHEEIRNLTEVLKVKEKMLEDQNESILSLKKEMKDKV
jgi:hypothetical protein